MPQFIDKSALVAEIERLKERFIAFHHRDGHDWPLDNYGKMRAYNEVLSFLNALEVKEVDMEKENLIGTFERKVKIDAGGYPYIDCNIEFYDYDKDIPLAKKGDKVKVIVVKREQYETN